MTQPGTLVMLNGASSSGKTNLLRALQAVLDEPFLDAGIDRFLFMLPEQWLERPLWDEVLGRADQAGEPGHRLMRGMHRAILALLMAGNNVIADHVLVEQAWLRECAELFAGQSAFLIGVRCSLEVLETRERQRKNRTLGQARLQHELVHASAVYDLEVHTDRYTPDECALQIQAHLKSGCQPKAFCRLKEQLTKHHAV